MVNLLFEAGAGIEEHPEATHSPTRWPPSGSTGSAPSVSQVKFDGEHPEATHSPTRWPPSGSTGSAPGVSQVKFDGTHQDAKGIIILFLVSRRRRSLQLQKLLET